jgi:hypothetical protein
MEVQNVIMTKEDIAKRYGISLSSINTLCSRNPEALPRFFKLGNAKNSPVRFRLTDVLAFEEAQVARQDASNLQVCGSHDGYDFSKI